MPCRKREKKPKDEGQSVSLDLDSFFRHCTGIKQEASCKVR